MDEPRPALPPLLPWAATACLAALVACLGGLLAVERARTRLLEDEKLLAQATLKATENQLEAERILGRREREGYAASLGAETGLRVLLLASPSAQPPGRAPAGAVALGPGGGAALLWASDLPAGRPDQDFQLWLLGGGPGYPADCGVFHEFPMGDFPVPVRLPAPFAPGCSFVLVLGAKGGERDLDGALLRGVIELASRPPAPKITK